MNRHELDRLHAAATQGEWKHDPRLYEAYNEQEYIVTDDRVIVGTAFDGKKICLLLTDDDARSIVALHNAWPAISRRLALLEEMMAGGLEGICENWIEYQERYNGE